jgi:hypothetical protein
MPILSFILCAILILFVPIIVFFAITGSTNIQQLEMHAPVRINNSSWPANISDNPEFEEFQTNLTSLLVPKNESSELASQQLLDFCNDECGTNAYDFEPESRVIT